MASSQTPTVEGDQITPKESEELTREKLILKYKTLMALTNKIKSARNEALAENGALKEEIAAANEKIKALTGQNATAEEMLAVLTDQKLKMAMEIDDMKKEKRLQFSNVKANAMREIEDYKQENEGIRKENNDLLIRLQDKDKNEIQLQNDFKKLQENNENVIVLCANVRKDKLDLQNKLEEVYSILHQKEDENKLIFELLSKQFSKHFEDLNSLKKYFENEMKTYCKYQCAEEINTLLDNNLNLKNKVEELTDSITLLLKEKECAETNLTNLHNKLEKLKSELSVVTSDRDQILNNLESVRLETKHLIENSEKLADELEISKADKIKNEHEMYSIISSKNEEMECAHNQMLELQRQNEELKTNLLSFREHLRVLEMKKCVCFKENMKIAIINEEEHSNDLNNSIKNADPVNTYNRIMSDLSQLSRININFGTVHESIKNINLQLLEKEVRISELESNKLGTIEEGYSCPNIKCICTLLKNLGLKLKEGMINYEKTLLELKEDVDLVKSQCCKINEEGNLGKMQDFISTIISDRKEWKASQEYNDVDRDIIVSKVEEYRVLNNLLENKILICKEELSCALTQLHNAEELEELMQKEIHSLKKHVREVISEREMLNEIINDKVKVIMKLDQELLEEQSTSLKLRHDLKNSQTELNRTKNALDEKCKISVNVKEKNVDIVSITELYDRNQILVQENSSLKNNLETISQEFAVVKLKHDDKNKLIIDLRQCNDQFKKNIFQFEEANKVLIDKLSNCKINVLSVQKEIKKLKKQFSDLQGDTSYYLCKLQDINQEVMTLFKDLLETNKVPENQLEIKSQELKENETITSEQKDVKQCFSSFEEGKEMNELKTYTNERFLDKECQVNVEENQDVKQELRKDAELFSDVSSTKKEVMSQSGEMDVMSDQNSAKIQSLETSLALAKQELATTQTEITQLREEFHSYRLRAQALLSKQKGELESQGEKEAKEQVEKLNNELECLRGKMEIMLLEDESLKNRLSTLQSEKEVTDKKYDDISRALHQKIIDYDTLNTEYNAFKLSTDTLIHNGKILLEKKYKNDIAAKEAIINMLKIELKEKNLATSDDKIIEDSEYTQSIHTIEEGLQEREDGEGSETAATSFVDRHEFVPLDILINNPYDDEENQVAFLQEQLNILTAELSSHDIRSKHLSSLLREAEKESARNSQQNAVLKEEVRRLERCLERQPLVANTEYLKNVVFKFFTLQSADERSRLVPVLDSILKLSPAEAQRLNEIARGEGGSRWSSYLHSWTGLG